MRRQVIKTTNLTERNSNGKTWWDILRRKTTREDRGSSIVFTSVVLNR